MTKEELIKENEDLKVKLAFLYTAFCFASKSFEFNTTRQQKVMHSLNSSEEEFSRKSFSTSYNNNFWYKKAATYFRDRPKVLSKILPKTVEDLYFTSNIPDDLRKGILNG